VHLAGGQRALERLAVGVGHHEHGAGGGVLRHHGHQAVPLVEVERRQVEHAAQARADHA
jgi:hypothetical protein